MGHEFVTVVGSVFQLITVEQDGHGRREPNVKNTIVQRLNLI